MLQARDLAKQMLKISAEKMSKMRGRVHIKRTWSKESKVRQKLQAGNVLKQMIGNDNVPSETGDDIKRHMKQTCFENMANNEHAQEYELKP